MRPTDCVSAAATQRDDNRQKLPLIFAALAVSCKRVLDGRLAMPESESSRARKYVEQRADCETETEGRPDDDYPQA